MQNETESTLAGKTVAVGVCSSIAVYKAAELVSLLTKSGAVVKVVMTENAAKLMSPRIFQTLSRNKTYVSMWEDVPDWKPEHISLAEEADLLLIAPATANALGNFAHGIAPDMLSTLFLATRVPVLVAPAMNCDMLANPAVVENIEILKRRGVKFVEPETGELACGRSGAGRLAPVEKIAEKAAEILAGQ